LVSYLLPSFTYLVELAVGCFSCIFNDDIPIEHGWEYTLRTLTEQYKHEISIMSLGNIASTNNKKVDKIHSQGQENNNNNNTIPIRLIAYIKCRYCDSEFNTEEEKNEHELEHI
jgi:hypothetical protein